MSFKRSKSLGRKSPARPRARDLRVEPLEQRQMLTGTQIFVNSSGDQDLAEVAQLGDGTVTLRSAIEQANLDLSGNDIEIDFAIAGSAPFVIQPGSDANHSSVPLPAITRNAVTINGLSEAGVVLDGSQAATGAEGLLINASNCTIEGLTIQNFTTGYGVEVASAGSTHADNNAVSNNSITNNGVGVAIVGDSATRDTANLYLRVLQLPDLSGYVVNSTATHNLVSTNQLKNNTAQGVLIQHASANTVSGNTIGDNGAAGVEIFGSGDTSVETFAGTTQDPNAWETYTITNSATGNLIVGNWIGIDALDADLGNTGDGVLIDGASLNTIGGTSAADRNFISDNTQNGVRVTGSAAYQAPLTLSSVSSGSGTVNSGTVNLGTMAQRRQTLTAVLGAAAASLGESQSAPRQSPAQPEVTTTQDWTGRVAVLNRVQSNFIGANNNADGAAGNLGRGVLVEDAARVTIIGADEPSLAGPPAGGNLIVANALGGVRIVGQPLNDNYITEPPNNYQPTPLDAQGNDLPQLTYALSSVPGQQFVPRDPIVQLVPTLVAANWIGLTSANLVLGNGGDGVLVETSGAAIVQNTISGNGDATHLAHGVRVTGTPSVGAVIGDIISGNKIGAKTDGTVTLNAQNQVAQGNWGDGVRLDSGVQFSFVGALPPSGQPNDQQIAQALRNVISGNRGWGVHVSGLVVNGQGVFHVELAHDPFLVPQELVYEVVDQLGKVHEAVKPYGTVSNFVYANYVGVDGSGALPAPNGQGGVLVDNAAAFTQIGNWKVGLADQFYSNVISANDGPGISITGQGTSVTVVGGNIIGLSATGGLGDEVDLGNNGPGVKVSSGALATNIGGDAFAASLGSRNYIAGNHGPGVLLQNLYDFRRAIVIPGPGQNAGDPIPQFTDPETGPAAWEAAIRAGTNYYGTAIVSNWIGLGVQIAVDPQTQLRSFTPIPIGNDGDGVEIVNSSNTNIGGLHPAWTHNTISANAGNGVRITGGKSFLTFIQQVFIGTDDAGSGATGFGNAANGVLIDAGAHHNVISGTGLGFGIYQHVLEAGSAAATSDRSIPPRSRPPGTRKISAMSSPAIWETASSSTTPITTASREATSSAPTSPARRPCPTTAAECS